MEILAAEEGLLHDRIARDMSQQPQLDLAVVRIHQCAARSCDKHLADLCAEFLADRNILQIRLGRAQASRGCDGILEIRVDAPIVGDDFQKPVGIGGLELCQHPVIQHVFHDRVLAAQLFQHVGIGAPSGFGFLSVWQHQLVKQYLTELLRGQNVEFMSGQPANLLLQRGDAAVQTFTEIIERLAVNKETGLLHLSEHRAKRQFDVGKELGHALVFQLLTQRRRQTKDSLDTGELCAEIALRKARECIIVFGRFEQVGGQRGIKDKALKAPPFVHKQTHKLFQRMGGFADLIAEQQIKHSFVIFAAKDMADGVNLPAIAEFERRQTLFPRQHRNQFGSF